MRAPVLAVGDGALGFWGAIADVFPATAHQRDWVHKAANILDALPSSVQAHAKRALREIWDAEDKTEAAAAVRRFCSDFAQWPKAVAKLTKDAEVLLRFYDFPAEHWGHLRTSNAIESTFAGACTDQRDKRTGVTRGGDRDGVQVARGSGREVAEGQRATPRRTRTRGGEVREW